MEPRQFRKGDLIQEMGEDVNEMIFVEKGNYGVGYVWGQTAVFAKQYGYRTVIGDWEIFNNKSSEFWYRAKSSIEGYCLKSVDIFDLKEEYTELASQLKSNINKKYLTVTH